MPLVVSCAKKIKHAGSFKASLVGPQSTSSPPLPSACGPGNNQSHCWGYLAPMKTPWCEFQWLLEVCWYIHMYIHIPLAPTVASRKGLLGMIYDVVLMVLVLYIYNPSTLFRCCSVVETKTGVHALPYRRDGNTARDEEMTRWRPRTSTCMRTC